MKDVGKIHCFFITNNHAYGWKSFHKQISKSEHRLCVVCLILYRKHGGHRGYRGHVWMWLKIFKDFLTSCWLTLVIYQFFLWDDVVRMTHTWIWESGGRRFFLPYSGWNTTIHFMQHKSHHFKCPAARWYSWPIVTMLLTHNMLMPWLKY